MTVRLTTLAIGVLVLTGGAATAQDRGDVSAGYRFLQSEGVGYPWGWYVDATDGDGANVFHFSVGAKFRF